jgi:tRNA modification GTPase
MPLHIIDTAGLRDNPDVVERIGIERALTEIHRADRILLVVDSTTTRNPDPHALWPEFIDQLPNSERVSVIFNKIDLSGLEEGLHQQQGVTVVGIAAKSARGIDALREHLKQCMGFSGSTEGGFTARRRHLDALARARDFLRNGEAQLLSLGAGELLAEDLRHAQNALSEITGEFTSDDLLGRIFSSFCIGK